LFEKYMWVPQNGRRWQYHIHFCTHVLVKGYFSKKMWTRGDRWWLDPIQSRVKRVASANVTCSLESVLSFVTGADPENQWGDGGLPKRASVMVKKQFSKPIWLSKTPFFSFLLKKNREGMAVVGSPNSWIRHCFLTVIPLSTNAHRNLVNLQNDNPV
jgi:hypothetical protein